MKSTTTVRRWGNSLAIRLPSAVAESIGLSDGSNVQITSKDNQVFIELRRAKEPGLDQLVTAINSQNKHDKTEWGGPVGQEVW